MSLYVIPLDWNFAEAALELYHSTIIGPVLLKIFDCREGLTVEDAAIEFTLDVISTAQPV